MNSITTRRFPRRLLVSALLLGSLTVWVAAAQQNSSPSQASAPAGKDSGARATAANTFHEDWNSISLQTSKFDPQPPLLGQKENLPDKSFVRELYQVQWRPNDPLDLYVIRPKGVAKPPVVLYLYSYPSDTERFKNDGWCTRVTGGGFAAVGFVSALTGHRFHDRPMKEWFVTHFQESLATSTHDVQMILNYLETRGDLDMQHVGMFGQGSGAAIAVLAAAADPRIKAVDLLDAWGDWRDWLVKSNLIPDDERPRYLKAQFLKSVAPLDPVRWLPRLKSRAVRMQYVEGTLGIPAECMKRMEAAAPKTVEVDDYGDERAFYKAAAGGRVFEWIKANVAPGPESKEVAKNVPNRHYYPPEGETIR